MNSAGRPVRIVIAEDHELVRSGIGELLRRLGGLEVVGEASDGREAVSLVEELHPDLVLMDVAMPGLNGLDATAQITRRFPEVRVLILSQHGNEEYVAHAFGAGAAGYLLKGAGVAELELAVRAVARGDVYLTPAVSRQVVTDYMRRVSADNGAAPRLTPRQREILQLVAEGHTSKDIARLLQLSIKTVESHRTQLMRRLGLHDIQGLVRYAIREGLVQAEPGMPPLSP